MIDLEQVVASHGPDDPSRFIAIADHFLEQGDHPAAAAALDRAYGLSPGDPDLARHRAAILDQLAVIEHGLRWRYVPAGTFLMGSEHGDPDERPVHPRRVAAFWITDVPITWAAYCELMGWSPPPSGRPPSVDLHVDRGFDLNQRLKIRLQYCESMTLAARDWHAHAMEGFGEVRRSPPGAPRSYAVKPMVAVVVAECDALAARLTTPRIRIALPSEAQWEKAARGGLVGKRFAWGDEPPTPERCDFDHFGEFHVEDPRALPANGYGVHGMCGGVWEWTRDGYDALAYRQPAAVEARPAVRVLRGGSWSDCAAACTVSYRMGRAIEGSSPAPNIGLRLVREAVEHPARG
ncbi:MAG TPA: SUMF1/EgtB/PvdO family nonheme iron enzyme [Kofleriaceae bacterium]|nr:SUMF1/EgtB/PvdO family nonheme iron enzyme [Kofleriaceae bacterium]